jgi:predicted ATPase/signal transduction histidine kinase/serine/threonine protein kinase
MITIPHYQVLSQIYDSVNSVLYRGIREENEQPVILKALKEDYPTPDELTHYQQEYEITNSLNLPGVIKTYGIEKYKSTFVIILEDFGGESLKNLINSFQLPAKGREDNEFPPIGEELGRGPVPSPTEGGLGRGQEEVSSTKGELGRELDISSFLSLAIQIADTLGQIHAINVIHKDINPSNIVWNQYSNQLKIIDFGIATRLPRENPSLKNPEHLEGTLAYISPEQTGRMNRSLDYRTDLYSLGITFYELLTGQLPFNSKVPLELVHSHIARIPLTPNQLNPDIPAIISNIIMKLMAKNAEDRYQSAFGLKWDLEKCQQQLKIQNQIEPFELAQQDVAGHFKIPQILYGRETEIDTLLQAFERVTKGKGKKGKQKGVGELMLVAGYSGIGKTALVHEVHKPMTDKHGYFAAGKFDQLGRNIPYSAMTQALNSFCDYLLTESNEQLQTWRNKIQNAIGLNGQVLIEVIPHLEYIIGSQPAVAQVGAAEAQNRFNFVFQNFMRVICQPKHPLILFLDDLQWADSASLHLIKLMMTEQSHLLLIGAYRDNEVHLAHPLMLTIEALQATGTILNTITLSPLTLPDITQLIADALSRNTSNIEPHLVALAELVQAKTGGNPFFMNEFLKTLVFENLLTFNQQQRTWQWDLEQIKTQNITDNIVELMANKVQLLEPNTQQALKLAACIGNHFTLPTLAIVYQNSLIDTYHCLWQAMAEDLILPLGYASQFAQFDTDLEAFFQIDFISKAEQFEYKFAHDRIQQAVYSLISAEQKQLIHKQVGQLLLQKTPLEKRESKIFTIVDHLNIGVSLIESQLERDNLSEFNLIAGKKAKMSAAYQPAFNYFETGIQLLGETGWQRQYALTLALWTEKTETAYLKTDFEQMAQLAQVVLQHAKIPLDQVKIYEIQIQAAMAQNQLPNAIKAGLLALKLLGIHFPEQPKTRHIVRAMMETKWALLGRRIDKLSQLPKMTNPHQLAIMRILTYMGTAAYMTSAEMLALIIFKQVYLSVKYGNESISAYVYAVYGMILCGVLGDIKTGLRFGKLAMKLLEQPETEKHKAKTLLIINNFIEHWRRHAKENLTPFLQAYQTGLETGDLEYAALAAFTYTGIAFIIGKPLPKVEREMIKYSQAIAKLKQNTSWQFLQAWRQVVMNLRVPTKEPCHLRGEVYDEDKMLPIHLQANDKTAVCFLYLIKLIFCYTFEQYQQAVDYVPFVEKYIEGITSLILVPLFYMYDSLARLALYPTASKSQQKRLKRRVAKNQKKMKNWAKHAPMNYLHKYQLVEAERARVEGQHWKAIEYYDKAANGAHEQGYLQEEALAYELAAKFWLAQGKEAFAQLDMMKARQCYQQWGALHKVEHLEDNYPSLCIDNTLPAPTATPATEEYDASQYTSMTSQVTVLSQEESDRLDLTSVTKASQAISSEIVLEKLLAKLMEIVIENAGAQKGCLLLSEAGELKIEASGEVDNPEITVLQSLPVENYLPTSIINYVARTQEPLLLANAKREGIYANDHYIKARQTKSVLCTPILFQNQLVGLIYLENNLMTNAFTPKRLQMLTLLSTQMAISLKNARFVDKLEKARKASEVANEAKTAFLANVSHELHTPLHGILGYAQLLGLDDDLDTDLLHESVEAIQRSGNYLLTLINDILEISKMETGQIELHPTEFYLEKFLKELVDIFQQQAKEKGLSFIDQSSVNLPTSIYVDQKRLRQILINLLSNAVKFTQQGRITFQVELLTDEPLPRSHYPIRFQLEDTGIGIAEEHINKILLPFEQVSDWKNKSEGAGLGLFLTKQLVDMMGGKLHIESTEGQGSRFEIILNLPNANIQILE